MKYMLMMFGDGGEMMATADPAWVQGMIAFMGEFDTELTKSGELLDSRGLAFPSAAKTVRYDDGQVAVTDGPYAESKESLAGYWVLEVPDEKRAVELAGRVAVWARTVELREVLDGPPQE